MHARLDPGRYRSGEDDRPPLQLLDVAAWDGAPVPARDWAVPDLIPAKNVALLSGHGATGKTTLALQLSAATVLARDWLTYMPEPGPAMMVCCEDDADELHRRLAAIASHYGVTIGELASDLHLVSLAGQDAVLGAPDKQGVIRPTPLFDSIAHIARKLRPRLLTIDNAADIYAGNENDRGMVRQFITMLRGLAIDSGAGLLLTIHPSIAGMNSGTGMSGSTAWFNSVRAQIYLKAAATKDGDEPDPDLRELEAKKSNYGPLARTTLLRWKAGAFVVEPGSGGLDRLAAEQHADELFLELLRRFNNQNRNVTANVSRSYAPSVFAEQGEANGTSKRAFTGAMQRLLDAGLIRNEVSGPPSRQRSQLVIV